MTSGEEQRRGADWSGGVDVQRSGAEERKERRLEVDIGDLGRRGGMRRIE